MVYRISAPTPEEKDEWIHSIKYVNAAPPGRARVSRAAPLTSVPLSRVQIGRQRRPFLRDASRQEEAYLAEEERGTALIFLQHVPQLLPAQNTSCP